MIPVATYADFLEHEYLETFVAEGGAAVKFVVAPAGDSPDELSVELDQRASKLGYLTTRVDAAATRIHMVDQVWFAIASQVDWPALAAHAVRAAFSQAAYPVPVDSSAVSVESVAAHYGVDAGELSRDVNRVLQARIYHEYTMVQEFRTAMLRLCQAQLGTGQVTEAEAAAVLAWLRGDLQHISVLKSALIFRKIGRHNARQLIFSLCHWLTINGRTGLLLELDARRLGFARRPLPEERSGLYYTKAAVLDAYEMLRQLIDNTDELSHCCVVVLVAGEFLTDDNRGVDAYQALKLRIHDEVRDRRRDNPYSSLVRLGVPHD
jgi:P-loop Domain of unknown function (DUF2791)